MGTTSKKIVLSLALDVGETFKGIGYDDKPLTQWCIREAYDTDFLESKEEFIKFAKALYDAQKWADSLPAPQKEEDEFSVRKIIDINSLIAK